MSTNTNSSNELNNKTKSIPLQKINKTINQNEIQNFDEINEEDLNLEEIEELTNQTNLDSIESIDFIEENSIQTQNSSFSQIFQGPKRNLLIAFFIIPIILLIATSVVAVNYGRKATNCSSQDSLNIALSSLSEYQIRSNLQLLSHDLFEGRAPGTRGEDLSANTIASLLSSWGYEPWGQSGNLSSTIPQNYKHFNQYFQSVALVGSTPEKISNLIFKNSKSETLNLTWLDSFIIRTDVLFGTLDGQLLERQTQAQEIIFVGYGINSSYWSWNDYKIDVTDKIIVSFVNEPPATSENPNLFEADTLTYFGRWTYKYEEARRKGARGIILIHTNSTAGYGWSVLRNSGGSESSSLENDEFSPILEMKSWINENAARQLAKLCGTTFEDWQSAAALSTFVPQKYSITIKINHSHRVRKYNGKNIAGLIRGKSDSHRDEVIVFTSHHDHLGIGQPDTTGDSIYNGAEDNASGTSLMLNVAFALSRLESNLKLERSILFLFVTAEEQGLLGSEYFCSKKPLIPINKIIANINVDGINLWGKIKSIVGVGSQRSTLVTYLKQVANEENLNVADEPNKAIGLFFRSDQFSFARAKIPALKVMTSNDYIDPIAAQKAKQSDSNYHQPSDQYDPQWVFDGAIQQARVALRLGYILSQDTTIYPTYTQGQDFP
eukprot:TRINITY_DN2342_c1_g3_i2.p1 TRINITY_DN2342_c1_g3~~TRINITY_DN2342_c1_g3_i2.p1  ORF type:complete len:679 (-),score=315.67 TRINITY_DN2342_c1_g3_i2:552-2543(-)